MPSETHLLDCSTPLLRRTLPCPRAIVPRIVISMALPAGRDIPNPITADLAACVGQNRLGMAKFTQTRSTSSQDWPNSTHVRRIPESWPQSGQNHKIIGQHRLHEPSLNQTPIHEPTPPPPPRRPTCMAVGDILCICPAHKAPARPWCTRKSPGRGACGGRGGNLWGTTRRRGRRLRPGARGAATSFGPRRCPRPALSGPRRRPALR